MALTMTRTRTQTTLTKLAQKLGDVKGELAFVEEWMAEAGAPVELARRRELLLEQAQALVMTLELFDPELAPSQVAAAEAEIRLATHQAREALRERLAELAVVGAGRVIEKEIDAQAHRDLLAKLAAQL